MRHVARLIMIRLLVLGLVGPSVGPAISQSLFVGGSGNSIFAPRSPFIGPRPVIEPPRALLGPTGRQSAAYLTRIRHLIGQAESRRDGYDAIQHGAKRLPLKRPTEMTLAEIFHWIKATPRQPHAIGRYQFIPATLRRLVADLGVSHQALFTPELQDQLGDLLLSEARLSEFKSGQIGRHQFMNNLAKIWAGLPNSTGKSHYHGYAGNRASMSWAQFDSEMAQIFPNSSS